MFRLRRFTKELESRGVKALNRPPLALPHRRGQLGEGLRAALRCLELQDDVRN